MKVTILAIGKFKEEFLLKGMGKYLDRISKFAKIELVYLKEENFPEDTNKGLEKEADKIIEWTKENKSHNILMDINGKNYSSTGFAKMINNCWAKNNHVCFIVGSSHGVHERVKTLIKEKVSFGEITIAHRLFLLVLLEQIYRAFTINNNMEYHK